MKKLCCFRVVAPMTMALYAEVVPHCIFHVDGHLIQTKFHVRSAQLARISDAKYVTFGFIALQVVFTLLSVLSEQWQVPDISWLHVVYDRKCSWLVQKCDGNKKCAIMNPNQNAHIAVALNPLLWLSSLDLLKPCLLLVFLLCTSISVLNI